MVIFSFTRYSEAVVSNSFITHDTFTNNETLMMVPALLTAFLCKLISSLCCNVSLKHLRQGLRDPIKIIEGLDRRGYLLFLFTKVRELKCTGLKYVFCMCYSLISLFLSCSFLTVSRLRLVYFVAFCCIPKVENLTGTLNGKLLALPSLASPSHKPFLGLCWNALFKFTYYSLITLW